MIRLLTDHPIAYNSPDHILPWGTMRDNHTSEDFIRETSEYFKMHQGINQLKVLDLGCSGGQLVIDYHNKGNLAVGLEGSDYSVKHQRANWPQYYNKVLFTCDITKPYSLELNNEILKFNLITAWEVIEHIHPDDLRNFFKYIENNLDVGGIFVGSISSKEEVIEGVRLHQSVFSEEEWFKLLGEIFEASSLEIGKYPFENKVRNDQGSFHIMLKKKK